MTGYNIYDGCTQHKGQSDLAKDSRVPGLVSGVVVEQFVAHITQSATTGVESRSADWVASPAAGFCSATG